MYEVHEAKSDDGWNVLFVAGGQGWGIGYTFTKREIADASARALNDNVALDQKATKAEFDAARRGADI